MGFNEDDFISGIHKGPEGTCKAVHGAMCNHNALRRNGFAKVLGQVNGQSFYELRVALGVGVMGMAVPGIFKGFLDNGSRGMKIRFADTKGDDIIILGCDLTHFPYYAVPQGVNVFRDIQNSFLKKVYA